MKHHDLSTKEGRKAHRHEMRMVAVRPRRWGLWLLTAGFLLVLTPSLRTARRMGLLWGAHAVRTRDVANFEEMVGKSKRMALRHGLASGGQRIIITAGVPFGTPGSTNVLHIVRLVGDELERYHRETNGD